MRIIREGFREHFINNRQKYFCFVFLLLIGFILGISFVKFVPKEETGFINEFLAGGNISFWQSFWSSISINARLFALIFLAGYFKPLKILSFIAIIIRGFVLGFAIRFAIVALGTKGLLLVFISSLPNLMLLLSLIIYFCVCSLSANNRAKWLFSCGFLGVAMVISSLIDGFVVPIFIQGVMKLF